MGKGASIPAAAEPQFARHLRPQQSSYGDAIAIVYGETRIAPHLVWADFFKHHDLGGVPSGGKAGGRVSVQDYFYTVALVFVLAEGGRPNTDNPERPLEVVNIGLARPGGQPVSVKDENSVVFAEKDGDIGGKAKKQPVNGTEPGAWRTKRVRHMGTPEPGFKPARFIEWAAEEFFTFNAFVTRPGDVVPDFFGPERRQKMLDEGTDTYAPENYPGLAVVAHDKMNLGSNASIPNWNFPLYRMRYSETDASLDEFGAGSDIRDAAPDRILGDLLTNWKHGAGWDRLLELLPGYDPGLGDASPFWYDSPASWGNYVRALGILISPRYDQQRPLRELISDLALVTDSAPVWSEGLLKMIPYGDEAVPASAPIDIAFTPETDPAVYTTGAHVGVQEVLTLDDFLGEEDGVPVIVERKAIVPNERTSSGYFNLVRVEYEDRLNAYAKGVEEAKDEAGIAQFGVIPRQPFPAPEIKTPALARSVAFRILQRLGSQRDIYHFTLGWTFLLLEPMDVVPLPGEAIDPVSMAGQLIGVRITSIEEDAEGRLKMTAEQFPRALGAVAISSPPPPDVGLADGGEIITGGLWTVLQTDTFQNPYYVELTGGLSSEPSGFGFSATSMYPGDPVSTYTAEPVRGRFVAWAVHFAGIDPVSEPPAEMAVARLRFIVDGVSRPEFEVIFAAAALGQVKTKTENLELHSSARVAVEIFYMNENGQGIGNYRQFAFNWTIHWVAL